jgi:hypothetical protein
MRIDGISSARLLPQFTGIRQGLYQRQRATGRYRSVEVGWLLNDLNGVIPPNSTENRALSQPTARPYLPAKIIADFLFVHL